MSEDEPVQSGRDQLFEEAAGWFARMRGPDAAASQQDFDAWLSRGALHRQAYNRAAEVFAMGKLLAEDEWERSDPPLSAPGRRRPLLAASAALVLAAVAGTWFAVVRPGQGDTDIAARPAAPGPVGQLTTGAAERRELRLADGSVVLIEPNSALEVRLLQGERRLALLRGQVRFRVAHEARPFVVHAGGGRIVARGTLFDVLVAAGQRVDVRLIEGAVDVFVPATDRRVSPGPRRLRPGEAMAFGAGVQPMAAGERAGIPVSSGAVLAGSPSLPREFDDMPLADLLALANQTANRPIRLEARDSGRLRISGRFRVDDPALLAAQVGRLFDLDVIERPNMILLRPR